MSRALLCLILLAVNPASFAAASKGIIRWDAWTLQGTAGVAESAMMSPSQWRNKCPFFTVVNGLNSVTIDHDSNAVAEAQNTAAVSLGIDHWVFLDYPQLNDTFVGGFNKGLTRYLASGNVGSVKFCMMIGGHFLRAGGSFASSDWTTNVNRYVTLMQNSQYQKVLTTRPLIYFYFVDSGFISAMGGTSAAQTAITQLRTACTDAGLGNPYIVQQENETNIGRDAISDYAFYQGAGADVEVSYATLTSTASGMWSGWAGGSPKSVPLAMMGWDYRPRWSPDNPYGSEGGPATWTTNATQAQKLAHIQAAVDFVAANPTKCEADAILIYAWNEFSEGGYLCPTLGPINSGNPSPARRTQVFISL